jgi:hypothetical protein
MHRDSDGDREGGRGGRDVVVLLLFRFAGTIRRRVRCEGGDYSDDAGQIGLQQRRDVARDAPREVPESSEAEDVEGLSAATRVVIIAVIIAVTSSGGGGEIALSFYSTFPCRCSFEYDHGVGVVNVVGFCAKLGRGMDIDRGRARTHTPTYTTHIPGTHRHAHAHLTTHAHVTTQYITHDGPVMGRRSWDSANVEVRVLERRQCWAYRSLSPPRRACAYCALCTCVCVTSS